MSNDPMRIRPEDMSLTASDLNRLSSDVHQFQNGLQRAWARLDSGWDWYAKGDITGHFRQALDEISRMAAMLNQMGQSLEQTANLIEVADQNAGNLFSDLFTQDTYQIYLPLISSPPGSISPSPELVPPINTSEPLPTTSDDPYRLTLLAEIDRLISLAEDSYQIRATEPLPGSATVTIDPLLALYGAPSFSAAYHYSLQDLHLEQLSASDLHILRNYLSNGELPLGAALDQVENLQAYWGYDNEKMVSALREIYYPSLLDPFIDGAKPIDASIYDAQDSSAALARALLMLSTQGENYRDPLLQIHFPEGYTETGEFGFDHVISGLDGYWHDPPNGPAGIYGSILRLLGTDTSVIRGQDANTWLGDLGATVQISLGYAHDHNGLFGIPDEFCSSSFAANLAAQAGYQKEMPLQDFNGDMFALAIIQAGVLSSSDHNLAAGLRSAFDPGGEIASQRYSYFAQGLGLSYDADTGSIDPAVRAAFIEKYTQPVSDFGVGIYTKSSLKLWVPVLDTNLSEALAKANIDQFLDQIEAGLAQEVSPAPGESGP